MIERDLFVSYGTRDAREIAEDIVHDLEARGLDCWVAPRNIAAGSRSWASEIVKGIRSSRSFLLLLSAGANASEEIEKELDEAARQRKPLFVIRVEDIEPSEGLGYHLNRVQWRDLFRNRDVVLNEIVARATALREVDLVLAGSEPVRPAGREETVAAIPAAVVVSQGVRSGRSQYLRYGTGMVAVAALAGVFWFAVNRQGETGKPIADLNGVIQDGTASAVPLQPTAMILPVSQPLPTEVSVAGPTVASGLEVSPVVVMPDAANHGPYGFREALTRRLAEWLPALKSAESRIDRYIAVAGHKAFAATAPSFTYLVFLKDNQFDAEQSALEGCQIFAGKPCRIVALNETLSPPLQPDASFGVSMPRVTYAARFDPVRIPVISDQRRRSEDVAGYANARFSKAAALHQSGRLTVISGSANQREAEDSALKGCESDRLRARLNESCFLYAIGMQVVLPQRATAPLSVDPMPSEPAKTLGTSLAQAAPSSTDVARRIAQYLAASRERALAVAPTGATWIASSAPTELEAEQWALERCHLRYGQPCKLVAINEAPRLFLERMLAASTRRMAYAGPFDADQIPAISDERRLGREIAAYNAASGSKAAAIHAWGRIFLVNSAVDQRAAEEQALATCNADPQRAGREGPCLLYASGLQVVLPQRRETPLAAMP